MDRRAFLTNLSTSASSLLLTAACAARHEGQARSIQVEEAGILDLQKAMAENLHSAESLTRAYLARIEAIDRRDPGIRAVITTNPDALSLARERDAERRRGAVAGPLHGIPVLVKDNLDTGDRMPTTAGSLALAGSLAPRDSFVVARLRAAGAIILGKTNLSEWANIRSSRSTSGWSAVGGQTRNPYVLSRSPSGSSSGSGVAVAANLCAAAVGTETDGSIVSPSSCCSVVGLKPTVGLVSRAGIIPISRSQDTAGPMARTVTDAAILLAAMAGSDPRDSATLDRAQDLPTDYTRFLDRDGLRGARLGVARQYVGSHRDVDQLFEARLNTLRDLGAVLVDPIRIPTLRRFGDAEFEVFLYELKAGLAEYLATRGDTVDVHSLADVIAFNERHAAEELSLFGQETFLLAEAKGPLTDPAYLDARQRCIQLARVEGIDAVMAEHRLDAIIAPTERTPPWLIDPLNGDHYGGGCSSLPAVAGTPHLTVPAGYIGELPVGLSFFGRAWSEPQLLTFGYAFEQATLTRRPPRFLAA